MRELTELIDQQSSGWLMVQQWLKEANNNYEVLPCDPRSQDLPYSSFRLQRSPR